MIRPSKRTENWSYKEKGDDQRNKDGETAAQIKVNEL